MLLGGMMRLNTKYNNLTIKFSSESNPSTVHTIVKKTSYAQIYFYSITLLESDFSLHERFVT